MVWTTRTSIGGVPYHVGRHRAHDPAGQGVEAAVPDDEQVGGTALGHDLPQRLGSGLPCATVVSICRRPGRGGPVTGAADRVFGGR